MVNVWSYTEWYQPSGLLKAFYNLTPGWQTCPVTLFLREAFSQTTITPQTIRTQLLTFVYSQVLTHTAE